WTTTSADSPRAWRRSTAARSSVIPTDGCSCRPLVTSPPCSSPTSISPSGATGWSSSRSSGPDGPTPTTPSCSRRAPAIFPTPATGRTPVVPIAEQIACMEWGGTAVLQQLPADDEILEAGDVLTYRCPDCYQRWDVVVDEEDLTDD